MSRIEKKDKTDKKEKEPKAQVVSGHWPVISNQWSVVRRGLRVKTQDLMSTLHVTRYTCGLALRDLRAATLLLCVFALTTALAQTPQQNAARLRLAQDFERMGEYERAAEIYTDLFNGDPRNGGYYLSLKRMLLQLRRYEELITFINWRLQSVEDVNTRVDLGDVYFKRGDIARAQELWKELLQRYPHPGTFGAVAMAMVDNRAYDEALQVYLQARQQLRNPTIFVLEVANLHALRLNYAAAATEYLRYLEANPRQFPFVQSKINEMANDDPKNLVGVISTLEQALPQSANPQAIHRLLAGVFMQNSQFDRALQEYKTLEQLSHAEKSANVGSEIFAYAELARSAGAYASAEQAYLMIVRDMPDSPYWYPAYFGLGQSLQSQGKYAEAQSAYAVLVEKLSGGGARSPWALRALLAQGEIFFENLHDMKRAIAIYTQIYERFPQVGGNERLEAIFRLGDCYVALGGMQQAMQWYEKAGQIGRNNQLAIDKVNYRQARLAFFQGRFRETKKLLESIILSQTPAGETESMVNDALELLLLLDVNMADSAGALLSFAQAEYAAAQFNQIAAIDTLESLLQRYPQSAMAPQVLFSLGNLYANQKQVDAAIARLNRILKQYPESIVGDRSLFRLAEIYEKNLRDLRKAQELYEQLLRDYPQSLYLEESRRRARELGEKNKSS